MMLTDKEKLELDKLTSLMEQIGNEPHDKNVLNMSIDIEFYNYLKKRIVKAICNPESVQNDNIF